MRAAFERLDDPQGMFAAARRIEFETPLAHWALSWPEARRLPAFSRGYVSDLTHSLLRKPITLPSGFSFSPKLTWRATSVSQERAQRARWASLNTLPPLNWLSLLFGLPHPSALRVHVESSHALTFVLLMTHDDAPLAPAVWLAYRGGPAALDLAIRTILLDDNPDATCNPRLTPASWSSHQTGKLGLSRLNFCEAFYIVNRRQRLGL